jgi:hypothetical protein
MHSLGRESEGLAIILIPRELKPNPREERVEKKHLLILCSSVLTSERTLIPRKPPRNAKDRLPSTTS